jgi:hypothetical protein
VNYTATRDKMNLLEGAMRMIRGTDAIAYAKKHGLPLCKYNDPIEVARDDLTIEDAEEVIREDPGLIYIEADTSAMDQILDTLYARADDGGVLQADQLVDVFRGMPERHTTTMLREAFLMAMDDEGIPTEDEDVQRELEKRW